MSLKVVIVGAEQKFWELRKESLVRFFITKVMKDFPEALYISGDCPKGGVDIWVREIAQSLNRNFKAYPPKKDTSYWYKKRNKQMAEEGDIIIDIEPKGHRSGGTWTLNYAHKLGKRIIKMEF